MKYQVDAISAVLVADHGDGDLALRLVLNVNGLILWSRQRMGGAGTR